MNQIFILGAGGHTRSSINLLKQRFSDFSFFIFDDSFNDKTEESIHNIKVSGHILDIKDEGFVFLSIGDNKVREKYFIDFEERLITENLFHASAIVEKYLKIGKANQIYANAYINSYVEIGDNNIINSAAILEHEVKIGNHNHISVGAKLCGRVKISDRCFIGSGAVVIDKIHICDDVVIGAGAVVIHSITESGTYVGNPARKIR